MYPLLIILLLLILLSWYLAPIFATTPKIAKKLFLNSKDTSTSTIPKIIWSYWQQSSVPPLIRQCHENWRKFAPDHELRVLHLDAISQWLPTDELPVNFTQLPAYRQADWLRLRLLKEYGGIWMDASSFLTTSLSWVHDKQHTTEYLGFYLDGFTTNTKQPIVENWFMAATTNSLFISDLYHEFMQSITMGEHPYIEQLKTKSNFNELVQNIPPRFHEYLTMHIAAAYLLAQNNGCYALELIRAEEASLALQHQLNWQKTKLFIKLCLLPCPVNLPPHIKLRGNDRNSIERYLARGWLLKGSALAKYLNRS
jgi:hypothetical protein